MGVPVAIIGASGYTGAELIRLLSLHPRVDQQRYMRGVLPAIDGLAAVFPQFAGRIAQTVDAFDPDAAAEAAEIAFCALPHGQSARAVAALRARGVTVVDLSADYRLNAAETYNEWYGSEAELNSSTPGAIVGSRVRVARAPS